MVEIRLEEIFGKKLFYDGKEVLGLERKIFKKNQEIMEFPIKIKKEILKKHLRKEAVYNAEIEREYEYQDSPFLKYYFDFFLKKRDVKEKITSELIRKHYEGLFFGKEEKKYIVDGKYFRKENIYIINGYGKIIHTGLTGEKLDKGFKIWCELYNKKEKILSEIIFLHYFFEFLHPYYDGNGRLGRFFLLDSLAKELELCSLVFLSENIFHNRVNYYNSFQKAQKKGDLTPFIVNIMDCIIKSQSSLLD